MEYKPLELTFTADKGNTQTPFTFKQYSREGDLVIYSKTKPGWDKVFYDVMRVKRHDGYTIKGNYCEPAEFLPSASQFGTDGYSYNNLDSALQKFQQMKNEIMTNQEQDDSGIKSLTQQQQKQNALEALLKESLEVEEVAETTPATKKENTAALSNRGRKKLEFELIIPDGEFTIKQLVSANSTINEALVKNRFRSEIGVTVTEFGKVEKEGRGRREIIYKKILAE